MSRAKVALFGLGAWGRNHYRVLSEIGALAAVHDPDPVALGAAAATFATPEARGVLADPSIAAVVVATPARTHFEVAKAALEAGKDVLVEKPLTLEVAEGETLVRLAAERRRVLMVGHVTLYHPAIVALRELVRDGVLGRLRYLYANRLNLGTVRESEDILWSFAPHDIAVFLHLLGTWPESILAEGGSYLRAGRADVTVTHLRFPDDVRGHIFVSWLHPFKEHRLVVIGDRRMASFQDGPGGGELRVFDAGAMPEATLNLAARGRGEGVPFAAAEPLRAELEHFLACVERREEPRTGGLHGLEVLRVLTAAKASLESGAPAGIGPRAQGVIA